MSLKSPFVLVLLASLFLSGPPAFAADDEREAVEQFEEAMKSADENRQVTLIEELAATGNSRAAKAIAPYMGDRNRTVKVAAIKALGTLKEKRYFGTLLRMMDRMDDDPEVLAAIVGAVGEYGDKRAKEPLLDVAKKWLPKDSRVSSAAARALGKVHTREVIEELIKLLDQTDPSLPSGSGKSISKDTRDTLRQAAPAIVDALQEITGWDFRDAKAWENFWEREQRSWRPGKKDVDPATLDEWEDPGYGFSLERPDDSWVFDRSGDYKAYRSFLVLRNEDNMALAFVWVLVSDTRGMTAEQKASKALEEEYKTSWKDIRSDSIVKEPVKVGKEKGTLLAFTGLDSHGNVAKVRNIYVVHDGMLFIIGSWLRSGVDEEVVEQLEEAMDSFEFLF